MRLILAAVMTIFFDVFISANIFVVYSAETEIVAQHFFRFGIGEVTGVFSGAERRYTIKGVYKIGRDFNSGGTFDPAKRKVLTSFDWKAEGRFNLATKATYEQLDLSEENTVVGSFTSTMTCNDDPWLEPYSSGRCQISNRQPSGKPPPFDSDLATTAPDIPF
jgi:hypothetical protein